MISLLLSLIVYCLNEKGEVLVEGTATVLAPTERNGPDIPWVDIREKDHYKGTMEKCRALAFSVAVVDRYRPT